MAEPNSARSATILFERDLRMGLVTRDVKSFLMKHVEQQSRPGLKRKGKTGVQRMNEKLSDSRRDEDILR